MGLAEPRPRCVHCLAAEGTTSDHGVPKSWYPASSAADAPRVQAPSCRACNQRLQKIEEQVLLPLALSLDPADPRCASVVAAVHRSMDPSAARNQRDRDARLAKRRKVQEQVFRPASSVGELPGFGPEGRTELAMPIADELLAQFGEKLTRVVFWSAYATVIERSHTVETHIVRPGEKVEAVADLIRRGHRVDVPPGVFLAIRRARDDTGAALVVTDLWGRLRLFTSVLPSA